jgi:hypothetical protein
MNLRHPRAFGLVSLLPLATGCDLAGGGSGTEDEGPLTTCKFSYSPGQGAGSIGASCASGADCEYAVCIAPGDTGNYTNQGFSFCSRGCECDNSQAAKIPEDRKDTLECLYTNSADGGAGYRHAVPQCISLDDCTAINPGYTSCAIPDHGSAAKVCQAL